jgi:hypothetical protein
MTTMTLPTPATEIPESVTAAQTAAKMRIAVHIDTEVLHPEVARRKANVWLLMYAGHLLRADRPELVIEPDQDLMWRYDVILTSPKSGDVGKVGQLRVRAANGEVLAPEAYGDELADTADHLVEKPKSRDAEDVQNVKQKHVVEKVDTYADAPAGR